MPDAKEMLGVVPPHNVDYSGRTYLFVQTCVPSGLATIVFALRALARIFVVHSIGADDYIMLAALLTLLSSQGVILYCAKYGMGLHIYDWELESYEPGLKTKLYLTSGYYLAVYWVKASILVFYLRLAVSSKFKKMCWGTIAVLTPLLIASQIVIYCQCQPLRAVWDVTLQLNEYSCIDIAAFLYSTSILSIITDIWILILPVRLLWRVQRPIKEKIQLLGVFMIGVLACIAGCIRLYTIKQFTVSDDPIYDGIPMTVWSFWEISLGIICASVPALKAYSHLRQRRYSDASAWSRGSHSHGLTMPSFSHHKKPSFHISLIASSRTSPTKRKQVTLKDFIGGTTTTEITTSADKASSKNGGLTPLQRVYLSAAGKVEGRANSEVAIEGTEIKRPADAHFQGSLGHCSKTPRSSKGVSTIAK